MIDISTLPEVSLQAVTAEELHRSTELFNAVKQLRLRLTNVVEDTLDRSYKQHVHNVFTQLEKKLSTLDNPSSKQTEIIMARHGLCDASMQQIVFLCESISPALGNIISQIRGIHSSYFADLQSLEESFRSLLEEKDRYCDEAKREVEAIDNECSQLMEASSLLDAEAARNTTLILNLRKELRVVNAEVARLHSMIDPDHIPNPDKSMESNFEKSVFSNPGENKASIASPNNKGSNMVGSPKGMDTSISRNIKGQVTFDTIKSPKNPHVSSLRSSSLLSSSMKKIGRNSQSCHIYDSTRYMDNTFSRKAAWGPSSSLASSQSNLIIEKNQKASTPSLPTKTQYGSTAAWLLEFRGEVQSKMDSNVREISLKECRSLINQFYESKENQIGAKGLPNSSTIEKKQLQDIETMEIHVYRCMEKKYGLRSLAVEHAAMFLTGLKLFSSQQIDIEVFYKIFSNEIEEGFIKVQQELEKSIKDLYVLQIMNSFDSIGQESLNEIVEQKLKGDMVDHEYMDIVNYLYNEKDATELRIILGVECQERFDKKTTGIVDPRQHLEYKNENISTERDMKKKLGYVPNSRKDTKEQQKLLQRQEKKISKTDSDSKKLSDLPSDYFDLPYETFVRLCLNFQLKKHEKYLTKFRAAFMNNDRDSDGILSSDEFRGCFANLRCGEVSTSPEDSLQLSDEECQIFDALLLLVDPNQTDRITFSTAAERLNSVGKRTSGFRKKQPGRRL